jgi:hypothetical protein
VIGAEKYKRLGRQPDDRRAAIESCRGWRSLLCPLSKRLDRSFERLAKVDGRLVADQVPRLRDVSVGVAHVARPGVVVDRVDVGSEDVVDVIDQFVRRR